MPDDGKPYQSTRPASPGHLPHRPRRGLETRTMPTFFVHNDRGDLTGRTPYASRVPRLVAKAVEQNLQDPNGPLDGRFGRVAISAITGKRYHGQAILEGVRLHPHVRRAVARGIADALTRWPEPTTGPIQGEAEVVALEDLLPAE